MVKHLPSPPEGASAFVCGQQFLYAISDSISIVGAPLFLLLLTRLDPPNEKA